MFLSPLLTVLSKPFRRREAEIAELTPPPALVAEAAAPALKSPLSTTDPHGERTRRRRTRSRGRKREHQPEEAGAASGVVTDSLPEARAPISESFRALGVDETGLAAIAALGFTEPTPIQREALPMLLDGEDLVGLAQTGTGKTIAFGLPLARTIEPNRGEVQAVVMVPTRELANQVRDSISHLGKFYGFTTVGLVGGSRVKSDIAALQHGAHVVVGTPGRVIDHLKRGTLKLNRVHFVVLDEADQMLDIGFARDIDYILRTVPKERQTALFSATMPESIGRLVYRYMRRAERVSVDPEQRTAEGIEQFYCEVSERDKFVALRYIYEQHGLGRTLIFRNTKIGVDKLTAQLQSAGVSSQGNHSDLRQGQRDRVMGDFKAGRLDFLVATNVAARGLDIPDIEHVINYDVPQNAEEYIHRIGRTARAGKSGASYTFVGEWDLAAWDVIVGEVGEANLSHLKLPAHWD